MASRKRGAREPDELVGEIVETPGVKVGGPPRAVDVVKGAAAGESFDYHEPPSTLPASLVPFAHVQVPPNVAAFVEKWAPVARGAAAAVVEARDLLAQLGLVEAPRRRRRRG